MTESTATTPPVFVETLFTGQPMTAHEEVACPVCQGLTNVRYSAYYDSYNGGRYVHFGCLSPQRIAEINEQEKQLKLKREQTHVNTNKHT